MAVRNAAELSAARDGATSFARFVKGSVGLETTEVPALGGTRVRLLTTVQGGVSFEGWLETTNLDFEAARDIELAGKTAYVPRGLRVSLVVGAGSSVVVSPWTRDLPRIDVTVGCDAIAIGDVPRDTGVAAFGTTGTSATGASGATSSPKTLALVHESLPVAATPGGEPVFTLHGGSGLRVQAIETKDGIHVHFEDGIVVDGWARAEDLEVPRSGRIHAIGCGVGIAISHSVPVIASLGVAKKEAPILVGESAGGEARGTIAQGGHVIVVRIDGAFAEVLTECGELVPATNQHFWIEAASLEIGAKVPGASLRASCK
jgi:hypothetical protein